MMDTRESERLMNVQAMVYLEDLMQTAGHDLNGRVLSVMLELYRQGWRDCHASMEGRL